MKLINKHREIVAKHAHEFQDETEIRNLQKKLVKDYLTKKKMISPESFASNDFSINKLDRLKKIKLDMPSKKKNSQDVVSRLAGASTTLNKVCLEFERFSLNIDLGELTKPKKKKKLAQAFTDRN
jgi:hypothetical protein